MTLYTQCTVHQGDGTRCPTIDICTLVRTVNADGELLQEHVCLEHRMAMKLPEFDVELTPFGEIPVDDRF